MTLAPAMITKCDALPAAVIYAGVRDLVSAELVRVLNVCSGNGRNAARCTNLGYDATAVNPVAVFVTQMMWWVPSATILRDSLSNLRCVRGCYGLALVNAFCRYVAPKDWSAVMDRLTDLMEQGSRIILLLCHSNGHPNRPVVDTDTGDICEQAACGLNLLQRQTRQPMQTASRANSVKWMWLVFGKGGNNAPDARP
ncbi:MAG: hypothetical protein GDA36_11015 [Rhodobacteraceae bacterium]|nr:hypothetical protein [Paracoccaceae bacterium]